MHVHSFIAATVVLLGVVLRSYANITSTFALVVSLYTLIVAQRELRAARRAALKELRETGG